MFLRQQYYQVEKLLRNLILAILQVIVYRQIKVYAEVQKTIIQNQLSSPCQTQFQ